jgi:hypothetical protein
MRAVYGEVTLSSGSGTLTTGLSAVKAVIATQKDATAVADGVSWSASGGTVTIDSSNGSSAETYTVLAFGH